MADPGRGEQHVAQAHAVVVGDRQRTAIVSTDHQRAREVARPSQHSLRNGEALAIGRDDEGIARVDSGHQGLQDGSGATEAARELLGRARTRRIAVLVRAVVRLERYRLAA